MRGLLAKRLGEGTPAPARAGPKWLAPGLHTRLPASAPFLLGAWWVGSDWARGTAALSPRGPTCVSFILPVAQRVGVWGEGLTTLCAFQKCVSWEMRSLWPGFALKHSPDRAGQGVDPQVLSPRLGAVGAAHSQAVGEQSPCRHVARTCQVPWEGGGPHAPIPTHTGLVKAWIRAEERVPAKGEMQERPVCSGRSRHPHWCVPGLRVRPPLTHPS